jgi:hypothetical protein
MSQETSVHQLIDSLRYDAYEPPRPIVLQALEVVRELNDWLYETYRDSPALPGVALTLTASSLEISLNDLTGWSSEADPEEELTFERLRDRWVGTVLSIGQPFDDLISAQARRIKANATRTG